jgi:hypothetical protein
MRPDPCDGWDPCDPCDGDQDEDLHPTGSHPDGSDPF